MSALCWTYRHPIFIRGINLKFSCSPFLPVVSGNDGKTEWRSLFIHYYRTGLTRVKVYSSWHVWQNAPVNPYSPKFQSIKLFMHVCVHMCVMCLHVCTRVHMHLKAKGSLISGLFPDHLPPYSLSRVSKWNRELAGLLRDPLSLPSACWKHSSPPHWLGVFLICKNYWLVVLELIFTLLSYIIFDSLYIFGMCLFLQVA